MKFYVIFFASCCVTVGKQITEFHYNFICFLLSFLTRYAKEGIKQLVAATKSSLVLTVAFSAFAILKNDWVKFDQNLMTYWCLYVSESNDLTRCQVIAAWQHAIHQQVEGPRTKVFQCFGFLKTKPFKPFGSINVQDKILSTSKQEPSAQNILQMLTMTRHTLSSVTWFLVHDLAWSLMLSHQRICRHLFQGNCCTFVDYYDNKISKITIHNVNLLFWECLY